VKVWKIVIGNNHDNWLQLGETIQEALKRSAKRIKQYDGDLEVESVELIGELDS
jgi:hypothetical protein